MTILEHDFYTKVPILLADILKELKELRKDVNELKEERKKSADKK